MSEEDKQHIHNEMEEYEKRKVGCKVISRLCVEELKTISYCMQKKWFLDIKSTPCARDALVHGILGGIAAGLLCFAKSSNATLPCPSFGSSICSYIINVFTEAQKLMHL